MKKSILAIMAFSAIVACKKNETTVIDNDTDSTMIIADDNSAMMPGDSLTASGGTAAMLTDQDKMFTDAAAKGGMMEVMLGEFAEMNGMDPKVKALGKMIKEDHTAANAELKSWAATTNYMLPSAMDADQQKMVDDLKMKKGMDFDKSYVDMMIDDHKKDIADFKKQAADGTGDLKAFAAKTIPVLESHLMKTEEAKKALK